MSLVFVTQYTHAGFVYKHQIDDVDEAIPDLTYSIKELREKFVLETELLKGKMVRNGQYLIKNYENDEDLESAFDSPSVSLPPNYDYVDADADKARIRESLVRLQQARLATAQTDKKLDEGAGNSKVQSSAGSGQDESGSKVG